MCFRGGLQGFIEHAGRLCFFRVSLDIAPPPPTQSTCTCLQLLSAARLFGERALSFGILDCLVLRLHQPLLGVQKRSTLASICS